jgi:CRP/FNR family transcriptional regulator, cyclic AMP receptor protein
MVDLKDLQKIYIFSDLNTEELARIKPLIFEKEFNKGTVLFFEGMAGGIMYLVKSGQIEIYKKQGSQEIAITTLKPGDFLGEMSLLDDEPRSAAARVGQDAVLLVITKRNFQEILKASPEGANKIFIALLRIMSKRLRDTNRKLMQASPSS